MILSKDLFFVYLDIVESPEKASTVQKPSSSTLLCSSHKMYQRHICNLRIAGLITLRETAALLVTIERFDLLDNTSYYV